MADDDRAFRMLYEEAREEVEKWPSWMRDEVVDIYAQQSLQDDSLGDDTFDE